MERAKLAMNPDLPDPADNLAHPVGHTMGHALRGGVEGMILGLPVGAGIAGLLPGASPLKSLKGGIYGAAAGTALGMLHGAAKAKQERNLDAMNKTASAYEAGRRYANALVKSALMKETLEGLGHVVEGVGHGTGKAMQGVGHVGRGLEEFVGKHMDRETAGTIAALAGVGGAGAAAMSAYKDSQQPYPSSGYYPAPF